MRLIGIRLMHLRGRNATSTCKVKKSPNDLIDITSSNRNSNNSEEAFENLSNRNSSGVSILGEEEAIKPE